MNYNDFDNLLELQFTNCKAILDKKAKEYAPDIYGDRLEAFKRAAAMLKKSPIQALVGQMSKHTISLFEMAERNCSDLDLWEEKIVDSINYLFLLKGLLLDEYHNMEAIGAPESRFN
jgi:hypothetical protein